MQQPADDLPPFPAREFREALKISLAIGLAIVVGLMLTGANPARSIFAALFALTFGWMGEGVTRLLMHDPSGRQ